MEKKKTIIRVIFIIGIILIFVSTYLILLDKSKINNKYKQNKNSYSNTEENKSINSNKVVESFFFNKNNNYAIYRTDAKKVTDYIYKYNVFSTKFRNGYSLVQYLDNEYAIVDKNGKEVIKKGEYKTIKYSGSRYLLVGKEGKNSKLLDLNLNVLMEQANLNMFDLFSESLYVLTDYKKIYVYSYSGKLLNEMDYKNQKIEILRDGTMDGTFPISNQIKNDLIPILFYDNKIYVYDLKNEYLINSIDVSNFWNGTRAYVSDPVIRDSFFINTGGNHYYIYNKKIIKTDPNQKAFIKKYSLSYDDFILNKKGEISFNTEDEKYNILYLNGDYYLKQIKGSKKIEVYVNGILKKTIDGIIQYTKSAILPSNSYGYYIIRTADDKYTALLDIEGNVLMKHDNIYEVKQEENYVKVTDDGKYYFVDLKNNPITPKIDKDEFIRLRNKFYINRDKTLIDIKTKKSVKYDQIKDNAYLGIHYVVLKYKDKYILFNTKENKVEIESNKDIIMFDYFYLIEDESYSYINNKKYQ